MANENENIKNENAENSAGGENKDASKHHTWVGDIIDKIEDAIDNIDADFPLSGGDEPHHTTHHSAPKTEEEIEEEKKKEEHKKTSFLHDLNIDFPLSGGEE